MLTELKFSHVKRGHYYALFRCECGTEKILERGNVAAGKIKSCGCLKRKMMADKQRTHGLTRSPTYVSWAQMKTRCENPNYREFFYYGGRGIKISPEWKSFEAFLKDMGERPEGTTLDRIDPNGNYEPKNCRWATLAEQSQNRRKRKDSRT